MDAKTTTKREERVLYLNTMESTTGQTDNELAVLDSKSRSKKRNKKSAKRKHPHWKDATSLPHEELIATKKLKKAQLILQGFTVSVTTLKENIETPDGDKISTSSDDVTGFNEVCQTCKEMGAQVTSQVSKRVQLLLCTRSAVEKATQRVRKAYKKKIPLVNVEWLEACRQAGSLLDMDPFRLDDQAKHAISRREKNLGGIPELPADTPGDTGWTESVSYGCSCVCHENGTEKECPWCSNGCIA